MHGRPSAAIAPWCALIVVACAGHDATRALDIADTNLVRPAANVCTGEPRLNMPSVLTRLPLHSYTGQDEYVHPDLVYVPGGWHGCTMLLAIMTYNGRTLQDYYPVEENSEGYVSVDGATFVAPPGLTNPILKADTIDHNAVTSDNDLVLNADGSIDLYTRMPHHHVDDIYRISTLDMAHWSKPTLVLEARENSLISPANLLLPAATGTRHLAWIVDASPVGCQSLATHVNRYEVADHDFAAPVVKSVSMPMPDSEVAWHLDVFAGPPGQLFAYVAGFPKGAGCGYTDVYFASSTDEGLSWKVLPRPLVHRGGVFATNPYRATGAFVPETRALLYIGSGRDQARTPIWRAATMAFNYDSTAVRLAAGRAAAPIALGSALPRPHFPLDMP